MVNTEVWLGQAARRLSGTVRSFTPQVQFKGVSAMVYLPAG